MRREWTAAHRSSADLPPLPLPLLAGGGWRLALGAMGPAREGWSLRWGLVLQCGACRITRRQKECCTAGWMAHLQGLTNAALRVPG